MNPPILPAMGYIVLLLFFNFIETLRTPTDIYIYIYIYVGGDIIQCFSRIVFVQKYTCVSDRVCV